MESYMSYEDTMELNKTTIFTKVPEKFYHLPEGMPRFKGAEKQKGRRGTGAVGVFTAARILILDDRRKAKEIEIFLKEQCVKQLIKPCKTNFMDGINELLEMEGACSALENSTSNPAVADVIKNIRISSNLCMKTAYDLFKPSKSMSPQEAIPPPPQKKLKSSHPLLKEYVDPWKSTHCECGLDFKTEQALIDHRIKRHTATNTWNCSICNKNDFTNSQTLKVHVRRVQWKVFRYSCISCNFGEDSFNRFKSHLSSKHQVPMELQCSKCSKEWASVEQLARHEKSWKLVKSYPCQYCFTLFKSEDGLQKHLYKMHAVQQTS